MVPWCYGCGGNAYRAPSQHNNYSWAGLILVCGFAPFLAPIFAPYLPCLYHFYFVLYSFFCSLPSISVQFLLPILLFFAPYLPCHYHLYSLLYSNFCSQFLLPNFAPIFAPNFCSRFLLPIFAPDFCSRFLLPIFAPCFCSLFAPYFCSQASGHPSNC